MIGNAAFAKLWREYFDRAVACVPPTSWDHQWQFKFFREQGLCVIPSVNLVSNIGFGPGATTFVEIHPLLANVPGHEMQFPLIHPPSAVLDPEYDTFFCRDLHGVRD
jgi:hypothetical protein